MGRVITGIGVLALCLACGSGKGGAGERGTGGTKEAPAAGAGEAVSEPVSGPDAAEVSRPTADAASDEPETDEAAEVITHCGAGEANYFSCTIAEKPGKVVSICGSPEASPASGWLQYRFGKPGAVELTYPQGHVPPGTVFTYRNDMPMPRISSSTLSFDNDGHHFSLTSSFFHGEEEAGLSITTPTGTTISLSCQAIDYGKTFHGVLPNADLEELHAEAAEAEQRLVEYADCLKSAMSSDELEGLKQIIADAKAFDMAIQLLEMEEALEEAVRGMDDVIDEECGG